MFDPSTAPQVIHSSPWDEPDSIFRGPGEPSALPHSPTPSRKSSVSHSSSAGSYFVGRLGAIAAVVELAISRWAGNASSSSSSSSSDSDSSAAGRSNRRSKSAHDFSARISRMQAREEARQIPRQFSLYLPPSLTSSNAERITQTPSLPSILGHLDTALKKSTKAKRQQERERSPKPQPYDGDAAKPRHLHFMLPDVVKAPSRAASFTDLAASQNKGKHKETPEGQAPPTKDRPISMPKAWFLDVSSPTWDDMRAIGKLLHLHPLTLEDILMKDPREKLERFPKLGYYFIAFRAIERWDSREKVWDQIRDEPDEGLVGEANVYLVVFNEGICCFHFTDISDHTDRVRNRIISLEKVVNMSSDWIAHGMLDSIVDSFFPFLRGLEREVMAIEAIVYSGVSTTHDSESAHPASNPDGSGSELRDIEKTNSIIEKPRSRVWQLNEKNVASLDSTRTRFPVLWPLPSIAKWKRSMQNRWKSTSALKPKPTTAATLYRMARARRLVASLSRLLASKSEVVTQLRKRLIADGAEVAIYLGDVQDHIMTLETALGHYERMLSQSHPIYISHIRTMVATTRSGSDKAVIFLSSVSIAVLCIQTLIGVCSINVNLPRNDFDGDRFDVFGVVLALAILILLSYSYLVRSWWRSAKRRRSAVL
ncbi:hypothetical protein B0H10DRAFT_2017107 [Mycena sp. CBHHK59/15]|nr:hypothetical protein B0H10DRAFT_2017107 [Mycena sp. CBHHK59/15]